MGKWLIGIAAMAAAAGPACAQSLTAEHVLPSQADPQIRQFDLPNLILSRGKADRGAPLAIYLPGTGGRPDNVADLLQVIARQGYRVIGLSYDDEPAVAQLCPRDPDPDCSLKFREVRTFGGSGGPVANPQNEAIVPRLVSLLRYLDREHPGEGWGDYLDASSQPAWGRILVSGLSQGAGMAALIAKRFPVYRVVLFSSPWDFAGPDRRPAPWLSTRPATPPERWWAERHAKEKTTDLIAAAYRALGIPNNQILIFKGNLPPGRDDAQGNPYHGSTVRMAQYLDQWRLMYGRAESGTR
ncbi:MAG TPA: hypothetical protein VH331_18450 [Allosphingosinicella sp.]|jgi:hypothetical protein|nr:hypothetical protein [Allosphingosinicella sp.]